MALVPLGNDPESKKKRRNQILKMKAKVATGNDPLAPMPDYEY